MTKTGQTDQIRSFLLEHPDISHEVSEIASELSMDRGDVAGSLVFLAQRDPRINREHRGVYRLDSSVPAEGAFLGSLMESRYRIAEALALLGGEVSDPKSGRATKILFDACPEYGGSQQALSGLMNSMENDGLVERDKNERRVYRIALTDRAWLTFGLTQIRPDEPGVEPEPEAPLFWAGPPPDFDQTPIIEEPVEPSDPVEEAFALLLPTVSKLANRELVAKLVDGLVDELHRGSLEAAASEVRHLYESTIEDLERRLAQQLDRTRSLEGTNRSLTIERDHAKDLVQARITEARGLRDRAETAETNLRMVTEERNRDAEALNKEQRDLERMMRERPHAGAVRD